MTAVQRKTDSALRSSEGAAHGWSPERRAQHAAAMRHWKPWAKSTGPRTASGKAIAAQNAYKHGMRSARQRLVNEALSAQRACLRLADLFRRVQAPPVDERRALQCPECGETMNVEKLHDVHIDWCKEHGVWLDNGELEAMLNNLRLDPLFLGKVATRLWELRY